MRLLRTNWHRDGASETTAGAWPTTTTADEGGNQFLRTTYGWLDWFAGRNAPNRTPPLVPILSFADVVRYFSDAHPNTTEVCCGALLTRPHPQGQLVFQLFLDERNRPCLATDGRHPLGRVVIAASLDAELENRFGGFDLILFE